MGLFVRDCMSLSFWHVLFYQDKSSEYLVVILARLSTYTKIILLILLGNVDGHIFNLIL